MSFVMFICIMLSVTLWIMGKGWRHSDGAYGRHGVFKYGK